MNTFVLIVLGQIVSLFGNAALRFALPLYLLRQTGSAALYGGITALAMLPALAGMLTGGALADRCRKARLMALLDLVTAGISALASAVMVVAPSVSPGWVGSLKMSVIKFRPFSVVFSAAWADRDAPHASIAAAEAEIKFRRVIFIAGSSLLRISLRGRPAAASLSVRRHPVYRYEGRGGNLPLLPAASWSCPPVPLWKG